MLPEMPLILTLVFVAVALVAGLGAWLILQRSSPERKRLEQVTKSGAPAEPAVSRHAALDDGSLQKITGVARFIPTSPAKMGRLRKRLSRAGYYSVTAALVFSALELLLPLLLAGLALLFLGWHRGMLIALAGAAVGSLLPGLVLERKIKGRQKRITNGLADALDLMIVCLEAGSGLDQAIVKTTEELAIAHPELAEELRLVTLETRAGKPRLEAFRNLAARTGVDEVKSLVSMLVQTDRFGTSIAQALRVHAETSRTTRRQRAEEKAAKLGVKLVFPLVFCLFPAFYVVALGPAVIQFMRFFKEAGY